MPGITTRVRFSMLAATRLLLRAAESSERMTSSSTGTFAGALLLLCVTWAAPADEPGSTSGYKHYLIGDPSDVVRPTSGLIVLQGGGGDVDENYIRMGAKGGGGDFVVLRASGDDDYNAYIYGLCRCDSVATIVFANRQAAYDPFVVQTIRNAEALFIAGGDQSRYVRFWKGTPVEDAINFVAAKPAPIGGTSAGMAILGEFSYSAMGSDSLTSAAALADPFVADLTLERDFLHLLPLHNVLTDQHLWERDRIGRTVALLARLVNDGWAISAQAIAADRETAVHIDPRDGTAEVFATTDHPTPYAYFMRTTRPPDRCEPGHPLTIRDVAVYRIGPGGRFDLATWTGHDGIAYALRTEGGVLRSSRGGAY
jgi:cyanophycinase